MQIDSLVGTQQTKILQGQPFSILQSIVEEEEVEEQENDTAQEYRNDGYIELVLKVMARMCDGQNHQLQVQ